MSAADPTAATSTLVGSLAPGTMLHEYRIEGVLGHGGFGITYLARDMNLDKKVAIKEYLPNDLAARAPDQTVAIRSPEESESFQWGLQAFIKEARVLAKFSHPSLIQVHRFFEANNTAYFVMEYAEGVTLSSLLKHEGPLPEERLRRILFPLLNGLEEVHRLGVLHRDIKPDNIILREGALPVLIDFGAARQNLSSMTRSVMSVLTAGYAPIEQYASGGNQGPWTDLYAIGAVAYRALSGKKPIDAINRIREDPLVPVATVGRGRYTAHFLAAIDWALAVNPEDRPASVSDLKLALDGALQPPPVVAPARAHKSDLTPLNRPPVAAPPADVEKTVLTQRAPAAGAPASWPSRGLLAGSAALLAVALAAAGFFLRSQTTAPAPAQRAEPPARPAPTAPTAPKPPVEAVAAPAPSAQPAPAETSPPGPEPAAAAPRRAAVKPAPKKPAAPGRAAVEPVARMSPLQVFQDCPQCPLMVPLPVGSYQMGAQPADVGNAWEGPPRTVKLTRPFAIGRHEVTVEQWQACVDAKGCLPAPRGPATGEPASKVPVVNVSWSEAQDYAAWLSGRTGRRYRLPTESEWEFAIRARTASARYWGGDRRQQCRFGNGADQSALRKNPKLSVVECNDGFPVLAPAGAFEPNAFGLYDMAGNAWEWVQDCWRDSYRGAPADGRAVEETGCTERVIRGGSWRARPNSLRSFGRGFSPVDTRAEDLGLRVAAE